VQNQKNSKLCEYNHLIKQTIIYLK